MKTTNNPLLLRRWEVALSFAALTAIFVISIIWLQGGVDSARHSAWRAGSLAREAHVLGVENRNFTRRVCMHQKLLSSIFVNTLLLEKGEKHEISHAAKILDVLTKDVREYVRETRLSCQ